MIPTIIPGSSPSTPTTTRVIHHVFNLQFHISRHHLIYICRDFVHFNAPRPADIFWVWCCLVAEFVTPLKQSFGSFSNHHIPCVCFLNSRKKLKFKSCRIIFFHYIWGNTNSTLEFKPRHLGCRWGLLLFHEPPVPWAWLRGFNFILKFDCHKNTSTQKSNYAASPYF